MSDTLPPVGATVTLPVSFAAHWSRTPDGWLSDGGLDLPDHDAWNAAMDRLARFEALAREAREDRDADRDVDEYTASDFVARAIRP